MDSARIFSRLSTLDRLGWVSRMKSCDYCGRENEDASVFCTGCGTEIQQPTPDSPKPAKPKTPRVLNAKYATIILIVVFAATMVGGIAAGLFGSLFAISNFYSGGFLRVALPVAVLVGQICGIAALVWVTAIPFGFSTNDTSPTGAAWVRGSWRAIFGGMVTGAIIFFVAGLILMRAGPSHSTYGTGYTQQMGRVPGFPQIAWIINAVLFAPVVEELLFRGVLYGGYRRSFGHIWSFVITTSIFVLVHFPNVAPIGIIELVGLALAALWWRLRSNAIGPCIAVHFVYNALSTLVNMWWIHRH